MAMLHFAAVILFLGGFKQIHGAPVHQTHGSRMNEVSISRETPRGTSIVQPCDNHHEPRVCYALGITQLMCADQVNGRNLQEICPAHCGTCRPDSTVVHQIVGNQDSLQHDRHRRQSCSTADEAVLQFHGKTAYLQPANFGPTFWTSFTDVTTTVAEPFDACSPLAQNMSGVAIVQRGSCSFATKVYNAQSAGASAVIVVNAHSQVVVSAMDCTDLLLCGQINIPSFFMTLQDWHFTMEAQSQQLFDDAAGGATISCGIADGSSVALVISSSTTAGDSEEALSLVNTISQFHVATQKVVLRIRYQTSYEPMILRASLQTLDGGEYTLYGVYRARITNHSVDEEPEARATIEEVETSEKREASYAADVEVELQLTEPLQIRDDYQFKVQSWPYGSDMKTEVLSSSVKVFGASTTTSTTTTADICKGQRDEEGCEDFPKGACDIEGTYGENFRAACLFFCDVCKHIPAPAPTPAPTAAPTTVAPTTTSTTTTTTTFDVSGEAVMFVNPPANILDSSKTVRVRVYYTTHYEPLIVRIVLQTLDDSDARTQLYGVLRLKIADHQMLPVPEDIPDENARVFEDESVRREEVYTGEIEVDLPVNSQLIGQDGYQLKVQTWPSGHGNDAVHKATDTVDNIVALSTTTTVSSTSTSTSTSTKTTVASTEPPTITSTPNTETPLEQPTEVLTTSTPSIETPMEQPTEVLTTSTPSIETPMEQPTEVPITSASRTSTSSVSTTIDTIDETVIFVNPPLAIPVTASSVWIRVYYETRYEPLIMHIVLQTREDGANAQLYGVLHMKIKNHEMLPELMIQTHHRENIIITSENEEAREAEEVATQHEKLYTGEIIVALPINSQLVGREGYRLRVQTWPSGHGNDAEHKATATVENIVGVSTTTTTTLSSSRASTSTSTSTSASVDTPTFAPTPASPVPTTTPSPSKMFCVGTRFMGPIVNRRALPQERLGYRRNDIKNATECSEMCNCNKYCNSFSYSYKLEGCHLFASTSTDESYLKLANNYEHYFADDACVPAVTLPPKICKETTSTTRTSITTTSTSTSTLTSTATTSTPTVATAAPTAAPTSMPTAAPTSTPTAAPTSTPTAAPTSTPTAAPTSTPTATPTSTPTAAPTVAPTPTTNPAPVAPVSPDMSFEDVAIVSPPTSIALDASSINVQFLYMSKYETANVRMVLQRSVVSSEGRKTVTYGVFTGHVKNGKLVETDYASNSIYIGTVASGDVTAKFMITPSMLELSGGYILKVQTWIPGFDNQKSTSVAKRILVVPPQITTTTTTAKAEVAPTPAPTSSPTSVPTVAPTAIPTVAPTAIPTVAPPLPSPTVPSATTITTTANTITSSITTITTASTTTTTTTATTAKRAPVTLDVNVDDTTSENDCTTLGWNAFLIGSDKTVCGESDFGLGPLMEGIRTSKCYALVDHESAKAVCSAVGARLCEIAEVPAASATGCGFDSTHIWTSMECPGGFIAIRGDGWLESIICTGKRQNVRCCADSSHDATPGSGSSSGSGSFSGSVSGLSSGSVSGLSSTVSSSTVEDGTSMPGTDVDCNIIAQDPEVCRTEGMANDLCSHSITGPTVRTLCPYLCGACTITSTSTSTKTTATATTKTTATTTTSTSFPCHIYKCGKHCTGLCGWSKAVKTASKEGTCIFGGNTVEGELELGECEVSSTAAPSSTFSPSTKEGTTPRLPLTEAPEQLDAGSVWDGDCQTADGLPAKVLEETEALQCAALCTVTLCTGYATQIARASTSGDCMLYFSQIVGAKPTTSSAAAVTCHVVNVASSETTTTAAIETIPVPRVVVGAYLQGAGDCKTINGAVAKTSEPVVDELDCLQLCTITACTGFSTENSAVVASPQCHLYFETIVGVTARHSNTALACYTSARLPTTSSTLPTTLSTLPTTSSSSALLPLTPTNAATTLARKSCSLFEPGFNYLGNDLQDGNSRASSVEECCKICSKRAGCKFFTFVKKTCWLKHSNLGRTESRKGISGSVLSTGGGKEAGVQTTTTTTADSPVASSTTAAAAVDPTTRSATSNSLQLTPFGQGCCETDASDSEMSLWVTQSEEECLALCDSKDCHGVELAYNYWKDVIKSVKCQTYSAHIINGNLNSDGRRCKKRKCWAKRELTATTVAATPPSGEVAWQIESSSTPDPTTTSTIDCTGPTAAFRVRAPPHLSDEYTWTGGMHAGRPVFEASGASEIYWYWMPAPLGVWSAGNAVGATSIYAYLLQDVESPVHGTRPFVIWGGEKWIVEATMSLAPSC